MQYYLAVDIGASSGRHILGWIENGHIFTQEMYRFENKMMQQNGHLVWDIESLFAHILEGMRRCAQAGKIPASMGIDTWAVDFVLLDAAGQRIGDAVAYRDGRTAGMDAEVEKILSFETLYQLTGIQKQPFNTIYQLMALKMQAPEQLENARHLLMYPDYFHFLLTGNIKQEYTNATSTALVNAVNKTWDKDLIRILDLPEHLFCDLSLPGTVVGSFKREIIEAVGFDCQVILPATHDTGSAFLAVPALDSHAVYLSSGTWSLLGIESPQPIISQQGIESNFTNEGGYGYRFRFLQNIMGLWMLQSIKKQEPEAVSYSQMEELAKQNRHYAHTVNVNSPAFLAPANMRQAICEECVKSGIPAPQTLGETIQCVYQSLALSYKNAVENLEEITGRKFTSINIVGGGCKDGYLNSLTAAYTRLPVYAGPAEGTVLGNLTAQMLAAKEFDNLQQARQAIAKSFAMQTFYP